VSRQQPDWCGCRHSRIATSLRSVRDSRRDQVLCVCSSSPRAAARKVFEGEAGGQCRVRPRLESGGAARTKIGACGRPMCEPWRCGYRRPVVGASACVTGGDCAEGERAVEVCARSARRRCKVRLKQTCHAEDVLDAVAAVHRCASRTLRHGGVMGSRAVTNVSVSARCPSKAVVARWAVRQGCHCS
jgi:hypothetical protein